MDHGGGHLRDALGGKTMMIKSLLAAALYIVLAPFVGGLIAGFDRIVTARMQGRIGPPLFQPFYDVLKLFGKQKQMVNRTQNLYVVGFFVFAVATGAIFFAGGDLLLTIFALTVAGVFLVLGAYSANSPYSNIGAERELLQMMSYEPMIIIAALGMYLVTKSFHVGSIAAFGKPLIMFLPGIFLGLLYVLTIKLRKSPFDLSTSHHGHQELVKGLTTEFSGSMLGLIEVAHWYENVFILGFIYLFFSWNPAIGVGAVILTYLLEILIDNSYARLTWQYAVKWSWIVACGVGVTNLIVVNYLFF
jgi:ech hydrogenase subunit B